jgi:hypothetical protein
MRFIAPVTECLAIAPEPARLAGKMKSDSLIELPTISAASGDSGTKCARPFLERSAGISQKVG